MILSLIMNEILGFESGKVYKIAPWEIGLMSRL